MSRSVGFPMLAGALVLLVVEAISAVGLRLIENRETGAVLDLFIEDRLPDWEADRARYVEQSFDADLGWTFKPGRVVEDRTHGTSWSIHIDADGSRVDPMSTGPLWIHTYGDSFTAGDEVDDEQTWQSMLGRRRKAQVKNFGVSGYGPYQALLRFERHIEEGRVAPMTIMAIYEDGARRIVNRYRPFAVPTVHTSMGFKPSMRILDGRPTPLPVPWDGEGELSEALWTAVTHDPFAEAMVRWRPPFTAQILGRASDAEDDATSWDGEGGRLVKWVLAQFARKARKAGSTPVVMWFPRGRSAKPGVRPRYVAVLGDTKAVEVDTASVLKRVDLWKAPWSGHPSPAGHLAVANLLHERLPAVPAP